MPTLPHPIAIYQQRRQTLAHRLGDGIALIPTAPEAFRNADTSYPYRGDSHFLYLTGFHEPDSVLVLKVDQGKLQESILFCRPKDLTREIWDGHRLGPEAAPSALGVDRAEPISALDSVLHTLYLNQSTLHIPLGLQYWEEKVRTVLATLRQQTRSGADLPHIIKDIYRPLARMRQIKDTHEINTLRHAAHISCTAHRLAMQHTRPGMMEYEIDAELGYAFRRAGAQALAYPSIVASGKNACVLHYVDNCARLNDGELLLIDAGCELEGYASDITRTFPVNGRFSSAQRDIYDVVLAAQLAAIATAKPYASWDEPHQAAIAVLAQGLLDLQLLSGSLDQILEQKSYQRFYMHKTGHWLGLDVHDVGPYKDQNDWIVLQSGMVFTVEPGLYIRDDDDIPPAFHNIGIRIEDDLLITPTGHDILTADLPKHADDIERLMQG